MIPDYELERGAMTRGFRTIAGVDEVGRGPLAGPVTAAAVVFAEGQIPEGLNDSKKLTARAREKLLMLEAQDSERPATPHQAPAPRQDDLFASTPHPLLEQLHTINPDDLTPRKALELLYTWKTQI